MGMGMENGDKRELKKNKNKKLAFQERQAP